MSRPNRDPYRGTPPAAPQSDLLGPWAGGHGWRGRPGEGNFQAPTSMSNRELEPGASSPRPNPQHQVPMGTADQGILATASAGPAVPRVVHPPRQLEATTDSEEPPWAEAPRPDDPRHELIPFMRIPTPYGIWSSGTTNEAVGLTNFMLPVLTQTAIREHSRWSVAFELGRRSAGARENSALGPRCPVLVGWPSETEWQELLAEVRLLEAPPRPAASHP